MGFRSLSELVRQSAFHYASTRRPGRTLLTDDLATLTMRLEELEGCLAELTGIVGRILGSQPRRVPENSSISDANTRPHDGAE
jgi:hypothetical protein